MARFFYLDMDGVARPIGDDSPRRPSTQCVGWINRTLKECDARVIIASDWRMAYPVRFFDKLFDGRVIAITPELPPGDNQRPQRWEEIKASMLSLGLQLDDIIVIDDNAEYYPAGFSRLIKCDPEVGFCEADYEKTVALSRMSTDQEVAVTITLKRSDLNKLTHVASCNDPVEAVQRAIDRMVTQYASLDDPNGEAPFSTTPMTIDD